MKKVYMAIVAIAFISLLACNNNTESETTTTDTAVLTTPADTSPATARDTIKPAAADTEVSPTRINRNTGGRKGANGKGADTSSSGRK